MKTLTMFLLMASLPFFLSSFTSPEDPSGSAAVEVLSSTSAATDIFITASYCGDTGISLTAHVLSTGKEGALDASNLPPDLDPNQYIKMRWYIDGVKTIDGPVTPCVCGKYAFLIVKNGLTNSVDSYFLYLPSC